MLIKTQRCVRLPIRSSPPCICSANVKKWLRPVECLGDGGQDGVLKPPVGESGLPKGEGGGGLHVLGSPNCPRAYRDSQTEDRRDKHTSKCVADRVEVCSSFDGLNKNG